MSAQQLASLQGAAAQRWLTRTWHSSPVCILQNLSLIPCRPTHPHYPSPSPHYTFYFFTNDPLWVQALERSESTAWVRSVEVAGKPGRQLHRRGLTLLQVALHTGRWVRSQG